MKKQAYQKPTIYNSDGTKAQTGTFDIRTDPLTNSTADGILDYYNNNLEALKAQVDDSANTDYVDTAISAVVRIEVPAGSTMDEKLTNAKMGITLWNEYNSQAYSPTGTVGMYTYIIFKPRNNDIQYAYAEAVRVNWGQCYRYMGGKWYEITATALS